MYKKKIYCKSLIQAFLGSLLCIYFIFISILSSLATIPSDNLKSNESLGMYLQTLIEISKVLQEFDTTAEEQGLELNFEDDIDLFHSDNQSLAIEQIKFSTQDYKHHFKNRIFEKIALEINTPPPDFS